MKKTLIAATLLLATLPAQAFYFTVPMAIGAAIGAGIGAQNHANRSIATASMLEDQLDGMPPIEVVAKSCIYYGVSGSCKQFFKMYEPMGPQLPLAAELIAHVRPWCYTYSFTYATNDTACELMGVADADRPRSSVLDNDEYDF